MATATPVGTPPVGDETIGAIRLGCHTDVGFTASSFRPTVAGPADEREAFPRSRPTAAVHVVHEADAGQRTLASDVDVADGPLSKARGLMARRSVPEEYALVFPFGRVATRRLHMVLVPFDVDALWLAGGEVRRTRRLDAWTGYGRARADTVVELPAGAADGVESGDRVHVEGL